MIPPLDSGQVAVMELTSDSTAIPRQFPGYRVAGKVAEIRPLPGNTGEVRIIHGHGLRDVQGARIRLTPATNPISVAVVSGDLAELSLIPAVAGEGVIVTVNVRGGGGGGSGSPSGGGAPSGGAPPPGGGGSGGNGGGGGGGGGNGALR